MCFKFFFVDLSDLNLLIILYKLINVSIWLIELQSPFQIMITWFLFLAFVVDLYCYRNFALDVSNKKKWTLLICV